MAVSAATLEITFQSKGTDKVIGDLRQMDRAVESTGQKSSGMFRTMAATAGGFLAASALQAIGTGFLDVGRDAVMAASDIGETMNKVGVVFGDSASVITDWAQGSATAMGLPEQSAMAAAATFGNLFTTMGVIPPEAATMSAGMVQLAADLASFHNVPIDQALAAIQSGLIGEAEPMRQFGVLLDEDTVKLKAMELGLVDANGEVTNQGKVLARQALIMENSATAHGDFAETSGSLANQLRILRAQWVDLSGSIGQRFLPAATGAVKFGNNLVASFSKLRTQGVAPLPALFRSVGTALRGIRGDNTPAWIVRLAEGFDRLAVIVPRLASAVGDFLARAFSVLVSVISTAVTVVTGILSVFESLGVGMDTVIGAVKGVGAAFLAWMGFSAVTAILSGIGAALAALLSPIGLVIAAAAVLGIAWQTNFLGIRDIVTSALSAVGDAIDRVRVQFDIFRSLGLSPLEAAVSALSAVFPQFRNEIQAVGDVIQVVADAVMVGVNAWRALVAEGVNPVAAAFLAAGTAIHEIGERFQSLEGIVHAVEIVLGSLGVALMEAFAGDWRGALSALSGGFASLRDVAVLALTTIIDQFVNAAQALGNWTLDVGVPAITGWLNEANGRVWDALKAASGWAWDGLAQLGAWFMETVAPELTGWIQSASAWVVEKLQAAVNGAGRLMTRLASWFIEVAVPELLGWVQAAGGWLLDRLQGVVSAVGRLATRFASWLIEVAVPELTGWVQAAGAWLLTNLQGVVSAVGRLATRFASWLIEVAIPELTGWVQSASSWLMTKLQDVVSGIGRLVARFASWLIEVAVPEVTGWVQSAGSWMQTKLQSVVSAIGRLAARFTSWLIEVSVPEMTGWVQAAASWMQTKLQEAVSAIGRIAAKFAVWLIEIGIPELGGVVRDLGGWLELKLKGLIEAIKIAAINFKSWSIELGEGVITVLPEVRTAIEKAVRANVETPAIEASPTIRANSKNVTERTFSEFVFHTGNVLKTALTNPAAFAAMVIALPISAGNFIMRPVDQLAAKVVDVVVGSLQGVPGGIKAGIDRLFSTPFDLNAVLEGFFVVRAMDWLAAKVIDAVQAALGGINWSALNPVNWSLSLNEPVFSGLSNLVFWLKVKIGTPVVDAVKWTLGLVEPVFSGLANLVFWLKVKIGTPSVPDIPWDAIFSVPSITPPSWEDVKAAISALIPDMNIDLTSKLNFSFGNPFTNDQAAPPPEPRTPVGAGGASAGGPVKLGAPPLKGAPPAGTGPDGIGGAMPTTGFKFPAPDFSAFNAALDAARARIASFVSEVGTFGAAAGVAFGTNLSTGMGTAVASVNLFLSTIQTSMGLFVAQTTAFGTAAGIAFNVGLSTGLGLAVASVNLFLATIQTAFGLFVAQVTAFGTAAGTAFNTGISTGMGLAVASVNLFLATIQTALGSFVAQATTFGTAAGSGFNTGYSTGMGQAVASATTFIAAIQTAMGGFAAQATAIGTAGGAGFNTGLSTGMGQAVASARTFLAAIQTAMGQFVSQASAFAQAAGSQFNANLSAGLGTAVSSARTFLAAIQANMGQFVAQASAFGTSAGAQFNANLSAGMGQAAASARSFLAAIQSAMGAFVPQAAAFGTAAGAQFNANLSRGMGQAVSSAQTFLAAIQAAMGAFVPQAGALGIAGGNAFTNGLSSGLLRAPGVAATAVNNVAAMLNSGAGAAQAAGSNIGASFASGMESQLGRIQAAAASLAAAAQAAVQAKAAIASPSRVFDTLGAYMGEGLARGITGATGVVTGAAFRVAQAAIGAARSALGIASPSRAMVPIGIFADEGLAMGIRRGQSTVVNEMVRVVQTAVRAAHVAAQQAWNARNGGILAEDNTRVNPNFYSGNSGAFNDWKAYMARTGSALARMGRDHINWTEWQAGARDAGAAMGGALQSGFTRNLGIASPSKVFTAFGADIGDGLAIGIAKQARSVIDAGSTLGQSLAEGIRSEVASVVEATRMLADEATVAAMVRMEDVRREAAALTGTAGTTGATPTAPASVQATATPVAGNRTVVIREGAFPVTFQISGAEMGDPEEFARRAAPAFISIVADALERQHDLGAGDGMGL